MVLILNQQRIVWLPLRSIKRQIEMLVDCSGYKGWDVGVHFVENPRIQELNKTYRNKDRPTDILSFPFHEVMQPEGFPKDLTEDDMNLGDMFLSVPYILNDCRTHNESFIKRFPILFTHGLCHLMGYDHELDEDYLVMSKRESAILSKFNNNHYNYKPSSGKLNLRSIF